MWQFLRDCLRIIERLVRLLSAHWEIAERLLKDHWKTIFMKDCRKTILNRFNKIWRPWRPWNSLKDHLGIMKDLGYHWKFTERSLRDLSICRVFQWSFRGCPMWNGGLIMHIISVFLSYNQCTADWLLEPYRPQTKRSGITWHSKMDLWHAASDETTRKWLLTPWWVLLSGESSSSFITGKIGIV